MSTKSKTTYIPIEQLKVGTNGTNRRVANDAHVNRIARELDTSLLGVFWVTPDKDSDGSYTIIDGQHRALALKSLGWTHQRVKCEVFADLEVSDQAKLFVGLNNRVAVVPVDRFKNEVLAGRSRALGIAAVLKQHGFRVDHSVTDSTITAVGALEKVYDLIGEQGLNKVLGIAVSAWGHISAAVRGEMIRGLGAVLARYGSELDLENFAEKLRRYPGGPDALIAKAKSSRDIHGSTLSHNVAAIIVATYNKGKRQSALSDWWTK